MENWTDIDWFANRYINWERYRGDIDLRERVNAFMNDNPSLEDLVERKVCEGRAYEAELERLERLAKAEVTRFRLRDFVVSVAKLTAKGLTLGGIAASSSQFRSSSGNALSVSLPGADRECTALSIHFHQPPQPLQLILHLLVLLL